MPRSYPKPVSNWEGIPNNVDDALKYSNGYTYFFKDGRYWRFDDAKFKVGLYVYKEKGCCTEFFWRTRVASSGS